MRPLFLLLPAFLFGYGIAGAQTPADDLAKAVSQYNAMRKYQDTVTINNNHDRIIEGLNSYLSVIQPLLDGVLQKGSDDEKNVARYFRAVSQYELGFLYGRIGNRKQSYNELVKVKDDYQYFGADSSHFPLRYKFNGQTYEIRYGNFGPGYVEYLAGMGEIAAYLDKEEEANHYIALALQSPFLTRWTRYVAINQAWKQKTEQEQDTILLGLTLRGLQTIAQLDTASRNTIDKYGYTNADNYANVTSDILDQHPEWNDSGKMKWIAAGYLDSCGERERAAAFYTDAISDGLTGKGELRVIINFAHRTGNGALEALAQKKLDAGYANETDPVIRNLGAVLNQVLASAHDLNDRLHSFRKRKVHAKRWAGDAWSSSLELPGALETILTEFLKNSQYNYYYWTSYIDEEKKANLQGRLRARYLKIGDELRSLFPQAKTRFRYDDPNYLEMVLDDTVTIVLSYYYREGDKDIISLSVDAQYPK